MASVICGIIYSWETRPCFLLRIVITLLRCISYLVVILLFALRIAAFLSCPSLTQSGFGRPEWWSNENNVTNNDHLSNKYSKIYTAENQIKVSVFFTVQWRSCICSTITEREGWFRIHLRCRYKLQSKQSITNCNNIILPFRLLFLALLWIPSPVHSFRRPSINLFLTVYWNMFGLARCDREDASRLQPRLFY